MVLAIENATKNCIFVYVQSACFVHFDKICLLQFTNVSRTRRSHNARIGFLFVCVSIGIFHVHLFIKFFLLKE